MGKNIPKYFGITLLLIIPLFAIHAMFVQFSIDSRLGELNGEHNFDIFSVIFISFLLAIIIIHRDVIFAKEPKIKYLTEQEAQSFWPNTFHVRPTFAPLSDFRTKDLTSAAIQITFSLPEKIPPTLYAGRTRETMPSYSLASLIDRIPKQFKEAIERSNFLPVAPLLTTLQILTMISPAIAGVSKSWNLQDCVVEIIDTHTPEQSPEALIPDALRLTHIFSPGLSGHGKSTLFYHLALNDMKSGKGLCVIDPKGDLVKLLYRDMPENRKNDCIYLDISNPQPLDLMTFNSIDEKEALAGDLKYLVTKGDTNLITSAAILDDVIVTLLTVPTTTFLDIYKFFINKPRQKEILSALQPLNPDLYAKWRDHFPKDREWEPITTRMNKFQINPLLSKALDSPTGLNIADCMNNRKILLVDVGGISESKHLYASLIISKIQQASFSRHKIPEAQRIPFYLFVDEFQNFQTSSFAKIISQSRGYGLGLTVACQWMDQLDSAILSACLAVSTFTIFALTEKDAAHFKTLLGPITKAEITNLQKFKYVYIPDRKNPVIRHIPPPPPKLELFTIPTGTNTPDSQPPSQNPPISHTDMNGYPTPSKAEDIEADPETPR